MQRAHLAQHAVNAVANAQELGLWLKVNVGCATQRGVGQQRINQAHHRVAVAFGLLDQAGHVDGAGFQLLQDAVDGELVPIELLDGAQHLGTAGQAPARARAPSEQGVDLIGGHDVIGVGAGDDQFVVAQIQADREQGVALGHGLGDQRQRLGIGHDALEADGLLTQLVGQRRAHRVFGDKTQHQQGLAKLLARALLLLQRNTELILCDQPQIDQLVAQAYRWLGVRQWVLHSRADPIGLTAIAARNWSSRVCTAACGTPLGRSPPVCADRARARS